MVVMCVLSGVIELYFVLKSKSMIVSAIDAIIISIVMVMTVVMLFMMWKYILRQDERWSRIALVAVLLLSVGLLVFAGYYWYIVVQVQIVNVVETCHDAVKTLGVVIACRQDGVLPVRFHHILTA